MKRHYDDQISTCDMYGVWDIEPQQEEDDMDTDLMERADTPIVPAPEESMFERLAKDPTVPVDKLERLIEMRKDMARFQAKADFDAAFATMQGEIPLISERGEILVNGQLRSKYARLEDILAVVRPILAKYGFAIRHRNEFDSGTLKVIGILSHRSGHSEEDTFVAKADNSGAKNDIQALGSTRTYGQRYTTISLLGIATTGEDDDGHRAAKSAPAEPDGYQDWLDTMSATADEKDPDKLKKAWEGSKPLFRTYLTKHAPQTWAGMKKKAGAL